MHGLKKSFEHFVSLSLLQVFVDRELGRCDRSFRTQRPLPGIIRYSRTAKSASIARVRMKLKKSFDWPMKSPSAVRAFSAPMAAPLVWVGRMMETGGSFRLRNAVGSGMIRLVWKSSPPNGEAFRLGKVTCTPVTGSTTSCNTFMLPALSDQV